MDPRSVPRPGDPHGVRRGPSRRTVLAAGAALGVTAAAARLPSTAHAAGPIPEPIKVPEAIGSGGAVSSVDPYASDIGVQVLRDGGNAVDAAIATAAALGVTEPYSCGIGGGGFFVLREARTGRVHTINGRENAPRTLTETTFTDDNGKALDFDDVVTSGLSVGVPGTLDTWEVAARRFGSRQLGELLEPAEELARRGFVVDEYYHQQTAENAERCAKFPASADLYLDDGAAPAVGSTVRNPDLADTYRAIRRRGPRMFYHGPIGHALVNEARHPSTAEEVEVFPGRMSMVDLHRYRAAVLPPTHSSFGGRDVYGMQVPSSGGIAVGQVLNLIEAYAERTGATLAELSEVDYLHWFSEACATAFADRNRWVGDVRRVPEHELLSRGFARERAELFDPDHAMERPVPFGFPDGDYEDDPGTGERQGSPYEGPHTTHFNVVDQWGNVVSYTFTIEQIGGSGITVPGHGFLLNNELTDFNFVPLTPGVPDPNLPGPRKQPRSSMAPTIIVEDGEAVLSCGTPGGSTIITTVAQIILGHLGRGMELVDAVAAPRLTSQNGESELADLGLADSATGAALTEMGHVVETTDEIGRASGIAIAKSDLTAAAETVRGGGGAARVVDPVE